MAGAQGDPYSSLIDRLQLPQPIFQRYAVNSIFERLKNGPPHTNLQSPVGQEALTRCLTSTQPAVIDQTVKEICSACAQGVIPKERGLQDLQAALDAVNSESLPSVINGICFLCQQILQSTTTGTNVISKSGNLLGLGFHPLVKSFQSRAEGHDYLLRQLAVFLSQTSLSQQTLTLRFLEPFISFIVLQPMVAPGRLLFARNLHTQLSTHSCQPGQELLLKMLITYVQLYQIETSQGHQFAMSAIQELVDVWEGLSKQIRTQKLQVEAMEEIGVKLLHTLVQLCHEILKCKTSLCFTLISVKRVIKSLRLLNPDILGSLGVSLVSFADMLAVVDLEQEQLLLLELGEDLLNDTLGRESSSNVAASAPLIFMWVFPALHVMSYPSVAVKRAALRLLRALDRAMAVYFSQENKLGELTTMKMLSEDTGFWGDQHLSVAVCRLLHSVSLEEKFAGNWSACLAAMTGVKGKSGEVWLRNLAAYLSKYSQRPRTVHRVSHSLGLSRGLLVLVSSMVTVCLLHPSTKFALSAAEVLTSVAKVEPIWGTSLLPVALFSVTFQGRVNSIGASQVQLGILKVFPSLAGHSTTLPLVLQALQAMLDSKSDIGVQAMATRVLCKTWESADRAFPHLQKLLRPGDIVDVAGQTELLQSRAACIRDVSEKDPDRGVDLVLSVQACIESRDSVVVSLGLQSLAFLCKEDVIDFYTAWRVISKRFSPFPSVPLVLESLCMLLGYGALDAAAQPDAARDVLEILWKAAKTKGTSSTGDDPHSRARAAAFHALSSYEVNDLESLCPEEKGEGVELLCSEASGTVSTYVQKMLIKALEHEHRERQRGQKEAKVAISKIGRMLKVFPSQLNAIKFSPASGKINTSVSDFPGAALLCFTSPAPQKTESISKKELHKAVTTWQQNYERLFLELADQLYMGGNLVVAMLSLQSWCSFVSGWLRALVTIYEIDTPNAGRDENLLRAAKYMLKIIKGGCDCGIPRVAENATLALAALCKVLCETIKGPTDTLSIKEVNSAMPKRAHGISEDVSVFLESQLLQKSHEYMQWSATLALGIVSTRLHTTDWSLKFKIVQLLLKHAGTSDRGIVRGACGLALGIICHNLLKQESSDQPSAGSRQRETQLLVQIILSLIQLTSETCPKAAPAFGKFLGQLQSEVITKERIETYPLPQNKQNWEEENCWAVVGLVWGLGSSVTGLSRLQCPMLVSTLADLITSWTSLSSGDESNHRMEGSKEEVDTMELLLAAGSCLALSTCVEVSVKLEILSVEVNLLLHRALYLINPATELSNSAVMEGLKPLLLCAFHMGCGNLLATILLDGSHSIEAGLIQQLLEFMLAGAENFNHGGWGRLGAMMGVANSLGAGGALLLSNTGVQHQLSDPYTLSSQVGGSGESLVNRPLLYDPNWEQYVSGIIRKLLEAVRSEEDSNLRSYAGWALAFIHNGYYNFGEIEPDQDTILDDAASPGSGVTWSRQSGYQMRALQDLPNKSTLRMLCTTLLNHENLPMVASVMSCLERAPRLPAMDWGGLVRRIMRQQVRSSSSRDSKDIHLVGFPTEKDSGHSAGQQEVRKQCVLFALAHAEQVPALASFVDELCELPRLGTLENPLRELLMHHLLVLKRIFSSLRLKQLLRDLEEYAVSTTYLSGLLAEDTKEAECQRSSFRVSLWKGVASVLEDSGSAQQPEVETDAVVSHIEKCMLALIGMLTASSAWKFYSAQEKTGNELVDMAHEWSAAIAALARANKTWLIQTFEVQPSGLIESLEGFESASKATFARCQLVDMGCLTTTELKVCRRWLLNHGAHDVSTLLVDMAWAVKGSSHEDRRDWLLDTLDTGFASSFPSTAIVLLALLASCWSIPVPLLPLNPASAVQDLPFTLPHILSREEWAASIGHSVSDKLFLLLGRLQDPSEEENQKWEALQFSDDIISTPELFSVLRRTCIGLKQFFQFENRLKLANLSFSILSNKSL